MRNNRNITCSHPENTAPGSPAASGGRLSWLSVTHWSSRESPEVIRWREAQPFAWSGEEMKKEPDSLCLISFCVIIYSQEIMRCPEMSPSFPRKHFAVCLPSPYHLGHTAWYRGRKKELRGCRCGLPPRPHPLFALQPISDQLPPPPLPTAALQKMPLNS